VAGCEVAEQDDDAGLEIVGVLGDGSNALCRHDGPACMHVGDRRS
jgi:hypothetical protein